MIFELAEKFPPHVCRLLARKANGRRPMSCRDLAVEAGLSKSYVAELSRKRTWAGIPIDVVEKFSLACGVDLTRTRNVKIYIRRNKKIHLRAAVPVQRKFFKSLMAA